MAVLVEDFSGATPGVGTPAGWSARWAALGTVSVETDVATIGGKYLRQTAGSGARRFISFDAVPSTTTDCEVLTLVRVGSYLTGSAAALTAISVVLRGGGSSGSENGYKVELNKVAGSGLSSELRFRISKYVGGADSEIAAVPYVWANDTWYWVRARLVGTVLKAKVWANGGAEPGAWTIGDDGSVTDASLTAGRVGFKSFDASRTHDVQYIGVSDDGSTVPVPGAGGTTVQVAATLDTGTTVAADITVRKQVAALLSTGSTMDVVFSGRVDLAATLSTGSTMDVAITVRKQIAAVLSTGATLAPVISVRQRLALTLTQGTRLSAAFLTPTTIALSVGGIPLLVVGDGASESAPEIVGERGRALSGRDAGRVRAEFRVRRFTLYEMSPAEWAALKTATPPGAIVTCGGTLLGGDGWYTVTREAAHDWHGSRAVGSQHTLVVTLTLTEAGA